MKEKNHSPRRKGVGASTSDLHHIVSLILGSGGHPTTSSASFTNQKRSDLQPATTNHALPRRLRTISLRPCSSFSRPLGGLVFLTFPECIGYMLAAQGIVALLKRSLPAPRRVYATRRDASAAADQLHGLRAQLSFTIQG